MAPRKIFIGGYTKSGTTFIGRALGLFNGVYARGEMDYLRLFNKGLSDIIVSYNQNLEIVNREVYDGRGELMPVTVGRMRKLHEKIFPDLFFNGDDVPDDCRFMVEKSPRNIFSIQSIELIFPDAFNIVVYRDAAAVFPSLLRHMADHRDPGFHDPSSKARQKLFTKFLEVWPQYIDLIENYRAKLCAVRYQKAADDVQAFLEFAQQEILGEAPGLRAPIETLSKNHYLQSLPEQKRAKSLVQVGPSKMTLSDDEGAAIARLCRAPDIDYDF